MTKVWNLAPAGTTPGCPEFQQHIFSFGYTGRKLDHFPFRIHQFDILIFFADSHRFGFVSYGFEVFGHWGNIRPGFGDECSQLFELRDG